MTDRGASARGGGGLKPQSRESSRFHLLDVLRGLAALSIVFWHWQHFFRPFNPRGFPLVPDRQPWYHALTLFYVHGHAAVGLFFCLSGFIFFWLYAERIARRGIGPGRFFVLRASRLYPLHFATLVAVAIGQWLFIADAGGPFVYRVNDAYHFGLQIVLISAWGLETGVSFNGPAWSVSVEALLYAVFFAFAFLLGRRIVWVALAAALALAAADSFVVQGLRGFFMGGLMHGVYAALGNTGRGRATPWMLAGTVLLWAVTLLDVYGAAWFAPLAQQVSTSAPLVPDYWSVVILFPATVLAVALVDERWSGAGARVRWIGDISYSSYLIHFPLQLATSLWVMHHGSDWRIFYRGSVLVTFLAVLIVVSLMSHHWFERPLQAYLRQRLLGAAPPRPA